MEHHRLPIVLETHLACVHDVPGGILHQVEPLVPVIADAAAQAHPLGQISHFGRVAGPETKLGDVHCLRLPGSGPEGEAGRPFLQQAGGEGEGVLLPLLQGLGQHQVQYMEQRLLIGGVGDVVCLGFAPHRHRPLPVDGIRRWVIGQSRVQVSPQPGLQHKTLVAFLGILHQGAHRLAVLVDPGQIGNLFVLSQGLSLLGHIELLDASFHPALLHPQGQGVLSHSADPQQPGFSLCVSFHDDSSLRVFGQMGPALQDCFHLVDLSVPQVWQQRALDGAAV